MDTDRKDDRSRTASARGHESGHEAIRLIKLWQKKKNASVLFNTDLLFQYDIVPTLPTQTVHTLTADGP